jgi:uncharacterized hydrophobic protein (TIGR00341 family)
MSMRIIEIVVSKEHLDMVLQVTREPEVVDARSMPSSESGATVVRVMASMTQCQTLIDKLHGILAGEKHHIVLLPTLAVIPEPAPEEKPSEKPQPSTAAREELYNEVAGGTTIDSTFVLLIIFSTLVAGIGLVKDNIAVVIGAMVITPLLGPNLAFAFGVALGDHVLMGRALRANLMGLTIAIGVSIIAGILLPLNLNSHEIISRTAVDYDSVALALAAGAANLLAINLVCVNLAAQVVLLSRGVRPRTWWQKKEAHQSVVLNLVLWGVLLLILLAIIYLEHAYAL